MKKIMLGLQTLTKVHPISQLIFSNVPEIVEQQQFVFDSFWEKGTAAEQRIKELEEGIISSVTII